jgi:uncharacterized protein YceH (UPF0502 family)
MSTETSSTDDTDDELMSEAELQARIEKLEETVATLEAETDDE